MIKVTHFISIDILNISRMSVQILITEIATNFKANKPTTIAIIIIANNHPPDK